MSVFLIQWIRVNDRLCIPIKTHKPRLQIQFRALLEPALKTTRGWKGFLNSLWAGSQTHANSLKSESVSRSVVSDSLWPHGLQHARLPCPSPTPGAYSNSCPSSRWCHPTISSSVINFSSPSHIHSCQASGSFPLIQFFTSGVQSIGISASASVLPVNFQDWFPLGWTGFISLQWYM